MDNTRLVFEDKPDLDYCGHFFNVAVKKMLLLVRNFFFSWVIAISNIITKAINKIKIVYLFQLLNLLLFLTVSS